MSGKTELVEIFDDYQRARWAVIEDGVVIWSGPTREHGEAWAERHGLRIEAVRSADQDYLAAS